MDGNGFSAALEKLPRGRRPERKPFRGRRSLARRLRDPNRRLAERGAGARPEGTRVELAEHQPACPRYEKCMQKLGRQVGEGHTREIAQPTPKAGLDKCSDVRMSMKSKRISHPLFRCTGKMCCLKVALVTNHRYKKCARTGRPSGPTKFSFIFLRATLEKGSHIRAELKWTRTRSRRSARRLQLGEKARLTVRECKNVVVRRTLLLKSLG